MSDNQKMCICCGKNPVTWPTVCNDCIDHEAQAELAAEYGYQVFEDPMYGDIHVATGYECHFCGMIYDGGNFCTYCGNHNPLEDPDIELDSNWPDREMLGIFDEAA